MLLSSHTRRSGDFCRRTHRFWSARGWINNNNCSSIMEMNRMSWKSCGKLMGLMLKQHAYHCWGDTAGNIVLFLQACFMSSNLSSLSFFIGGCSPRWTSSVLLPGSHQTKPHSSAVTYQIQHRWITSELPVSVREPQPFYCSCVFFPLLEPSPSHLARSNIRLCFWPRTVRGLQINL